MSKWNPTLPGPGSGRWGKAEELVFQLLASHPALSWACSKTSLGTRAVRQAPALRRGGYGGAGGSSDLAWASGLELATRITPPSSQAWPLGYSKGERLCDLDLGFPL